MPPLSPPAAPPAQPTGPVSALHGVEHYENFPVASVLMPRAIRPAVIAIYRFARFADDVADEGDATPQQRIARLASLRLALAEARSGRDPAEPVVAALVRELRAHRVDWGHFDALLSAFEQDVTVTRYPDRERLLDYCRRSADPVGRLMLELFGCANAPALRESDAICSALQLINFVQDVALDWDKGRIYLPLDEMGRHGVGEAALAQARRDGRAPAALRALLATQAEAARAMLESGRRLPSRVPLRLRWELRAILAGGHRILDRLARVDHDVFAARPTLGRADALPLLRRILQLALVR